MEPDKLPENKQPSPETLQTTNTANTLPPKKSKKKVIVLSLLGLVVVAILVLVAYEYALATKYRHDYKNYVGAQDFKNYSNTLHTFLDDRNRLMASMYSCNATTAILWPEATANHFEGVDIEYTRAQDTMRTDWIYAKKALPNYKGGLLSTILPQSKTARKLHKTATDLLSTSEKFFNADANELSAYCAYKLYPSIVPLSYLKEYTDTQNLQFVIKSDVESELQYLDKVKAGKVVTYNKVPNDMTDTESFFNTFLTKLQIDLNTLLNIKKTNAVGSGDYGALNTSFAADIQELDNDVLAKAAIQGRKITPSPDSLRTLLDSASNDR